MAGDQGPAQAENLGEYPTFTIRVDPLPITDRLRIGVTRGNTGLLTWEEPSRILPLDRDPEVLDLWDLLEARGHPEKSPRHCRLLALAAKGAIRIVNGIALTTASDMAWYFGQYQRLAESIARRGVVSLHEAETQTIGGVGLHDNAAPDYPGIAIWRDGQLLWFGEGRHRVTIARWLGVRPVPVSLRVLNKGWLDEELRTLQNPQQSIVERLNRADMGGHPTELEKAERWLASLDGSPTFPDSRPDPHGINEAVDAALGAHRQGRLDAAMTIWNSITMPGQLPPFVDVLAAETALGLADLDVAGARLRQVLTDQPTHIAANAAAADLARLSGDLAIELHHLDIAFSEDPGDRKLGLRFARRLIRADRLDRADQVIDALSIQDFDALSVDQLEYLRARSRKRRERMKRGRSGA